MREFIAALAAVVVLSFVAASALDMFQRTADQAFTGAGTRVDPPTKPQKS